jgi:tetratricopeptide (TPR) repeat protein
MILNDMGAFSDALVAFELSRGAGRFYDKMGGLGGHADALRGVGRPREAAALRREALATRGSKGRLALYQGLIGDYRAAGDVEAGRDAALEGMSAYPRAANLYAQLAELELDAGDPERVPELLALSDRLQPAGVFRSHLVRARMALADGDYNEARGHLATLRKRDLRNLEVLQVLIQLEMATNGPAAALGVLQAPAWNHQDHPGVAALEALALFDAGEHAEARERVRELERRYPLRGDVKALRYVIDSF